MGWRSCEQKGERRISGFVRHLDAAQALVERRLGHAGDDEVYIETEALSTKTSNRAGRRRKPLPIAGFSVGIRGTNWGEALLDVRRRLGLNATVDGILKRAPQPDAARRVV